MAVPDSDQQSVATTLHEAVLQTLASAVISLRPDGVITTFNSVASEITGLEPDDVVGHTFAEVFLAIGNIEDFAQAVLDSVYTGPLIHQRVVEADFGNGRRSLSMSVSRITGGVDEDSGVAVVFEDITELQELQAKELALAREVDEQHRELRQAYLDLEEQNTNLEDANRQTRIARIAGYSSIVVLLTVIGLYVLDLRPYARDDYTKAPFIEERTDVLLTVQPQELTKTITVTGQLAPRREVDITSPINGKISAIHTPYGALAKKDQTLIELDVTEVRIQHRDAEASYIKALERSNDAENWGTGVDVSRAKRSVAKAKLDLEDSRKRLEETAFLLERGVIPSSEHDAAQRSFTGRQLDLEAAEQDLASVLKQGAAEARVAKLELENAKARLDEISATLSLSVLKAPVDGVVMRPPESNSAAAGNLDQRLAKGDAVTQGERLLIVGDVDGLAVQGRVDEVDVIDINIGDEVLVRGDAFPNTTLHGVLDHVSSEARVEPRSLPFFEVKAVIPQLTEEQRQVVRVGMSAVLEVIVRHETDAVLVPLNALALVEGQPTIRVMRNNQEETIPVVVGETTVDRAEIIEGIAVGDQIVVAER